jgi:predicted DNA-binding WGR domain protein
MMTLLVRIEPEKKMDRWYMVGVQPTLLDPWVVICAWGSRRTNYQRVQVLPMQSFEAAREVAGVIVRKKIQRGYSVVRTKKRTVAQY